MSSSLVPLVVACQWIGGVMAMMIVVIFRMKTAAQNNHVCNLSSVAVLGRVFLVDGDVMASLTARIVRMRSTAVRMFPFVIII